MEQKELLMNWMDEGMVSVPQVLLAYYNKLKLTEIELVLLLQIFSYKQKGRHFPTFEELAAHMTISSGECSLLVKSLSSSKCLPLNKEIHWVLKAIL